MSPLSRERLRLFLRRRASCMPLLRAGIPGRAISRRLELEGWSQDEIETMLKDIRNPSLPRRTSS